MSSEKVPEDLYYLLVIVSHMSRDVNALVERIRVCGTYTVLKAAKTAARTALFDAGFEREWFTEYEMDEKHYGSERQMETSGSVVHAVAPDGTTFDVFIRITLNAGNFMPEYGGEMIRRELYHLLQTTVIYSQTDPAGKRQTDVEGSFGTFEDAKRAASTVLLSEEDGITRDSFAEYSEAGPGEKDCGYTEDVVVHAVAENGENYLVRVMKTEGLEAVKQAHAAGLRA